MKTNACINTMCLNSSNVYFVQGKVQHRNNYRPNAAVRDVWLATQTARRSL